VRYDCLNLDLELVTSSQQSAINPNKKFTPLWIQSVRYDRICICQLELYFLHSLSLSSNYYETNEYKFILICVPQKIDQRKVQILIPLSICGTSPCVPTGLNKTIDFVTDEFK
jgi:hypothetical protein